MTIQRTRRIEVSDIAALVFDCNACGAKLSLVPSREINLQRFERCPACNEAWLAHYSVKEAFSTFHQGLKDLIYQMGAGEKGKLFTLRVETQDDGPASSTRDA